MRDDVRTLQRLRLEPPIRDELRAQQWELLSSVAAALALRCSSAAFSERKIPQARNSFNSIEDSIRGLLEQFQRELEQVLDDRRQEV